jgi:dTDP-4-amino-4,6-dideoxygalactose transaminase
LDKALIGDLNLPKVTARRKEFLQFSPPFFGQEEIDAVTEVLKTDWITTGPKTKQFEKEFAAAYGAEDALALNSCTAGLHVALLALGVGPGDEVIVPDHTFCATCNVVEHVGAIPVLVDVQPDTLNIDPARVEEAITSKTKAVMPVHFAGHPVDIDEIRDLATGHGFAVIEDAAHAITAKYKGRFIGSEPNLAAFSFYATKNLSTAEGGMLTGPADLVDQSRIYALHGMNKDAWKRYDKSGSWYYEVVVPGHKYNMTDIQAALGLTQMKKLDRFQQRRREVYEAYNRAFSQDDALIVPVERPYVESSLHLYPLRLNLDALKIDRDQFIRELTERNIGTSVHFIPMHTHPFYRDKYNYPQSRFPVTNDNYPRIITIPLHPRMSDEDISDVVNAVMDVAAEHRR